MAAVASRPRPLGSYDLKGAPDARVLIGRRTIEPARTHGGTSVLELFAAECAITDIFARSHRAERLEIVTFVRDLGG
jgi:hypothetical protein